LRTGNILVPVEMIGCGVLNIVVSVMKVTVSFNHGDWTKVFGLELQIFDVLAAICVSLFA
jgi:hypothetical protein